MKHSEGAGENISGSVYKEGNMQLVLASYDGGYTEGLMIGKRHYNADRFEARHVMWRIEEGKIEEAYEELLRMLDRMEIRPASHYSILYVADAAIFRLLLAVDHENVVDYEWISYNGEVRTGRFAA